MDNDWKALARAVRDRREALDLRQSDLPTRGGPSLGTVQNIEQATRERYATRTFAQLDRSLDWKPGTVDRILRGDITKEELEPRWAPADSEGRTWAVMDAGGRFTGRVEPAAGGGAAQDPDAIDLPHGDAVARLSVELLAALVAQPSRTEAERAFVEHLYRFIGDQIETARRRMRGEDAT